MSDFNKKILRSEVARWSCFDDQTERKDYADRLYDAIQVDSHRKGFQHHFASVMARIRDTPELTEAPSVDQVLQRVRSLLTDSPEASLPAKKDDYPVCGRCSREGGITTFGNRLEPQKAVLLPAHKIGNESEGYRSSCPEPLCSWHVELSGWEYQGKPRGYPPPRWSLPATPKPDLATALASHNPLSVDRTPEPRKPVGTDFPEDEIPF